MTTVVAFAVLLGVLITVHELGHFLVAKAAGVRVLTFSIGFGPRLFGKKIGETDYRVSLLPLGGYVRMYGDEITEEVPNEERERAFLHKPFLVKSAISLAGPLANLILPVGLFFALFLGQEQVADAVVGTVMPGEPAEAAGLRAGDRIVAIDGKPVAVFDDFRGIVESKPGVPVTLGLVRDGHPVEAQVTPRAAKSPTPFDEDRVLGRIGLLAARELPVVVVAEGSPAFVAGLRTKDKITSIDGAPIRTRDELLATLDGKRDTTWTVAFTRVTPDAKEPVARSVTIAPTPVSPVPVIDKRFAVTNDEVAALTTLAATRALTSDAVHARALRRGVSPMDGYVAVVADGTAAKESGIVAEKDRIVAVDGRAVRLPSDLEAALQSAPHEVHSIGVLGDAGARVIALRMGPHPQRQLKSLRVVGAGLATAYGDEMLITRNVGPVAAMQRAVDSTGQLVVDVVKGFGLLFTGKVGLESLGGPITIFNLAGQAAEADASTYIHLMGLISINLFILNLLPIPVLDGGHLMMFVIEAIQRRRLTVETRILAMKVGLVLVGILMVIAIGNDLLGLF